MQLLDQLMEQNNFTSSEITLANYILNNLDHISKITLQELADKAYVSRPTAIRFYRRLGYKTYNDFRLELEMQKAKRKHRIIDSNKFFQPNESYMKIAENIAELSKQVVDGCYNALDEKALQAIVQSLYSAKRIFLFAIGDCYIHAEAFIHRLANINIYAQMLNRNAFPFVNIHNLNEDDVVIVLSTTGKTLAMEQRTIQLITKSPAKTILLTSSNDFNVKSNFDINLKAYTSEDGVIKIGPLGSQVSMLYVLNVLYSCLFDMNYEENVKMIQSYSDFLDSNHIVKKK